MGHRSGDCNCNAAQLQKQLLLWQKLQPRQALPTSRDHTVNFVRLFVLTQMSFTFKFVRSSWSKYFASDLLLHLDFSVAAYLICHFAARHVQNMALCWIIAERRKLSSIICGSVWLYKLQLNIMWECEGTAASQPRYRFCLEILLALKKKKSVLLSLRPKTGTPADPTAAALPEHARHRHQGAASGGAGLPRLGRQRENVAGR